MQGIYLIISKFKPGLLNEQLCLHIAAVLSVTAKQQKFIISFVISPQFVRPHRKNRVPPIGFSLSLLFDSFSIILKKIQVTLKCDKKSAHFTFRTVHIYRNVLLNSSQNKKCLREDLWRKPKHTLCVQ